MKKIILITGSAGFIGFHVVKKLLSNPKNEIVGIDNINNYYSPKLKKRRLGILKKFRNFKFYKGDISNNLFVERIFKKYRFHKVINLAAQAGVRYSITNPRDYIDSNIIGFYTILEACRNFKIKHLIFASSSSVYGDTETIPFSEDQNTDAPVSFYAATKKSNEVMAHAYSSLYQLKITGLRFFTVYGPWGRPDMAPVLFAKAGIEQQPIKVFNNGEQSRDFTYIDDIVQGIVLVAEDKWLLKNYQILNIGKGSPVSLMDFIHLLEKELNIQFDYHFMPPQKGDVVTTYSDTTAIGKLGYKASTPLEIGIPKFVTWFLKYYNHNEKN